MTSHLTAIPDGAQDALLTLMTRVFPFPIPKSKKAPGLFAKAFAAAGTPQATTATMEAIDNLRNAFLDEICQQTPNQAAVSAAADRYAPQLHRIIKSIDSSADPVRLTQRMQFQWTSALNTQALADFKLQEVFIFEMAMVLFTKGLAQINQASAMADPSSDRFADVANLLKQAGGVFMALSQDFLPRWKETPENASSRHPETSEGVSMAMIDLLRAQAQMMYIAKGIFLGTTPKGTLAKLAVMAAEKLDKCVSNFRARASSHFVRLDPDFLVYLTFMPALFRGLAYRLLAIAHWEKGDHGNGIALLQQALVLLKSRQDVASMGLPTITESHYLSKYQPQVEILRKEVQAMLNGWKHDNNMIYFAAVPDAMSLPPLPSGMNMITITKYEYASTLPDLTFSERLPDAPPTPASAPRAPPPAPTRTDSDLARELQEKLNVGQP